MKNINTNRVSADISPELVADIIGAIQDIAGKMPFLVTLGEEERKHLIRVGSGNKRYADEAYAAAVANPGALAGAFSVEEMGKDIHGFNSLKEILQAVDKLAVRLRDTQALMGAEAYMAALAVYQSLEVASRNGVEGAERARKALSARFKGQGRRPAADGRH